MVKNVKKQFLPLPIYKYTSMEVVSLLKSSILFHDYEIVGISKPYNLPLDKGAQELAGKCGEYQHPHTLTKYLPELASHLGVSKLYQVHRIDKNTSGVILFATTPGMHKHLTNLFREKKMEKVYWAITNGIPEPTSGIVDIPIGPCEIKNRHRMMIYPNYKQSELLKYKKTFRNKASPAVTEFTTLKSANDAALVELRPETGLTHQLRVHLSFGLNVPIIGDHKYSDLKEIGPPLKLKGKILQKLNVRKSKSRDLPLLLHSRQITIPDILPKQDIIVTARIPIYFRHIAKELKLI